MQTVLRFVLFASSTRVPLTVRATCLSFVQLLGNIRAALMELDHDNGRQLFGDRVNDLCRSYKAWKC